MKRPKQQKATLYSEQQFAELLRDRGLRVSTKSLQRWRARGVLPFYRLGNFVKYDDSCADQLLEKNRRNVA
jgi:hypothetical protein